LEEGLKDIWDKDNVGVYKLAPLRRVDVSQAAEIAGIKNAEDFLEEINRKNVVPLAIKPITLEFIIKTYHRHGGQFSPNQRLYELYFEGCLWLCEERNKSRISSKLKGNLERRQRLILAARIAAITVFGNKFVIWTGTDWGNVSDDDLLKERICQGTENFDGREFEISQENVEEVLDTTLFSSRGELNRMGWAHQTYAEFLAAWYLVQHETPLNQIMKLISYPEDYGNKLIPQLHETAAWLASMRSDVLHEIMKTDPDVLLRSDVPTDPNIRAAIVDNLLKHYEEEKIFDFNRDNYSRYEKLKHSGITVQLRPYIQDSSKPFYVRDAAIDIAEVCEVNELQEDLVNLALDSSQEIELRISAAKAICKIGNTSTRLRLKPLAINQVQEDENDQLKGYALKAIWSEHLTAEELFNIITPPKRRNYLGAYRVFLDFEILPRLQPSDLQFALDWVEKQGLMCFVYLFEKLADAILIKAWEYFYFPGILQSFTRIALMYWRKDQQLINSDNKLQKEFQSLIINNIDKRRKLIEETVITVAQSSEDIYFLLDSLTIGILLPEDIFWMLQKLRNVDSEEERIWTKLINWKFNIEDVNQINTILVAIQNNNILRKEFAYYLSTIDLYSDQAENLRANYQRKQVRRSFKQNAISKLQSENKILIYVEQLELGNLSAWWQLTRELLPKIDSRYYYNESELNLTKLLERENADIQIRTRIIEGAKKYVKEYVEIDYTWIKTNAFHQAESAGFKALLLLLQEAPDILNTLSSEIWQRWASIIVGFPYGSQTEQYCKELVKWAYLKAPTETLNTLISIIDKKNEKHNYIFILSKFDKCWDDRFKAVILEKAKDAAIKPECMGQLLEELLKHESNKAREFAQLLVSVPLPLEEAHQKAVVAAKALVEYAEPISWNVIWSAIQQDTNFGREVFEAVANRYVRGLELNLTEKQLADLYIWLVWQYPYAEDPDHSNDVIAHNMSVKEMVVGLRDSVLTQLKEIGTSQACMEIERISEEFPELKWLKISLLNAQEVMRRESWQPLQPEEILQIITTNQSLNMKTILILASSPINEARLRLDKEVREIEDGLQRSQYREQFTLKQRWAVRPDDLRRAMLHFNPQIIHFCGHGSGDDGLVLENDAGNAQLVPTNALASLFKLFAKEGVECVVLNACYAEVQAEAISQHINYVVGMSDEISDDAALKFSVGFYDALGAGRSYEDAYEFGCNAIALEGIPEELIPVLKKKTN
jgi:hypothetical protein